MSVVVWITVTAMSLPNPSGALEISYPGSCGTTLLWMVCPARISWAAQRYHRDFYTPPFQYILIFFVLALVSFPAVTISRFRGGILFLSYLFAKDGQASANPGFLQLINTMNEDAATSRYYRKSNCDLAVESWYAGEYNRSQFGVFLDIWPSDWTSALSNNRYKLVRYVR